MSLSDKVVILERTHALGKFSDVVASLQEVDWQVMVVDTLSPVAIYNKATIEGFDVTVAYIVTDSKQDVISCHDVGCTIVFVGIAEFPEETSPLYVAKDGTDAVDFITTASIIFGRFKVPVGG